MNYFVTGGTGFIGRHLIERLARRGGTIQLLVRSGSRDRFEELARQWRRPGTEVHAVEGDVTLPDCGVDPSEIARLRGEVDHFFHAAAVYDMSMDEDTAERVNVEGMQHTLDLAEKLAPRACFHHVSSIAVAGRFHGMFLESMFDEGQEFHHPYFSSKFRSEALVRNHPSLTHRIYRPGAVVGDSRTGEMDKIDGPYYTFSYIKRMREGLPQWFPMIGLEGGVLPLVPVDYVVDALDHIAHAPGHDGKVFQLVDPSPRSVGDVLAIFCRAAHAPEFAMRLELGELKKLMPFQAARVLGEFPTVRRLWEEILQEQSIPPAALEMADCPTVYDCRETLAALEGSGIACPPLEDYGWRLWDYWERNLDSELLGSAQLESFLTGKVVVVTGASSGIGRAVALKVARSGGIPLLLARRADRLEELAREIRAAGGDCRIHSVDLSNLEGCDAVVKEILAEHGAIDVLVNNAGRSIRRSLIHSTDRFHDFERTMEINYFAAVRLIMGFLPSMRSARKGHIVNISSIGSQVVPPRFAAYAASKSALDSFSKSLSAEVVSDGIHVTTIYMPLVRTEMISPTRLYDMAPALSADEAAELVVNAMVTRPKTVATKLGTAGAVLQSLFPKLTDRILNTVYRIMPESAAAKGEPTSEEEEIRGEAVLISNLLKGIHL